MISIFLIYLLIWKKNEVLWVSVWPSGVFSQENIPSPQITYTNHMTMTTSGQI